MANLITSYTQNPYETDEDERERRLLDLGDPGLATTADGDEYAPQPSRRSPGDMADHRLAKQGAAMVLPQASPMLAQSAAPVAAQAAAPMAAKAAGASAAGGAAGLGGGAAAAGLGPMAVVPVIADYLQNRAKKQQAARDFQSSLHAQEAQKYGAPSYGLQAQQFKRSQKEQEGSPLDYLSLLSKLK